MEVVGEAILSAALAPLIGKLTSGDFLKFVRKDQEDVELKHWKSKLLKIQAVLSDAEEKQITSPVVKSWLSDLRDLAYDVEDILDEIETEALECNSREESQASTSTVRKLLPTCCIGLKPTAIISNVKTGSKLEEITRRFQKIDQEKDELNLATNAGGKSKRVNRRVTTSLVKEPHVYGREKDKEAIIKLMMTCETSDAQFSVIPIIGVGGLGKTTLAQLIYNDVGVKFDCKAWVCVSDDFDICGITKTILQHWGSCDATDLNVLQQQLKEKLSGQKFLIVLDDVWNENYEDWMTLRSPFVAGAPGSRIIVTTRNKTVSLKMSSIPGYELRELSHNDCLSLFAQHALDAENFDAHSDLKEIGERIVQRCKGLPLAAKTLGGLLRGKQSHKHWEDLLRSKIWDLPDDKCSILPVLRLSYHYLPSYLKQCFAYCAIFPKDYEFDKSELVLLWMAEGFLQQHKKDKLMEDLGHEYFDELFSRSFFQVSSKNKSRYVMHDMISDLAQSINREVCFCLVDSFEGVESFAKVRHSSFTRQKYDTSQRFEGFHKMKNLRTFLALSISLSRRNQYLSNKVLHDLLPTLRQLRSLSLTGYHLKEFPSSIGDLRHLRYLNLSCNEFKKLPESLGKLFNLQTLILFKCKKLIMLPACIGHLSNLRHLDIRETDSLKALPPQMGDLTIVQTLSKFIVGQGFRLGMQEMMKFRHLQGELHIIGLQNVGDIIDAELANLKGKQGLEELTLEWIDDFHCLRNESNELQVLNALRPQQNLKKLSILSYGGTSFPSWLGDPAFTKLALLKLHNCHRSTSVPSVGQLPLLRDLSILAMDGVKEVGVEFLGDGSSSGVGFPSLKSLLIGDMLEWEKWSWSNCQDEGVVNRFPKLHELTISNCPKLVGKFPTCLASLKRLSILDCPLLVDLSESLPSLCELNVEGCQKVSFQSVASLSSLKILSLKSMQGLACLNDGFVHALGALEDLRIDGCDELTYLWQDGSNIENLSSLKYLVIRDCKQLVSFIEGEEECLPCNLEKMGIWGCNNLEKLPNGLHRLTSLGELRIEGCRKLVCFPEGAGLPYSLKLLHIKECDSLESLPDGMMMVMDNNSSSNRTGCLLRELEISGCPSLKYFPKGKLPTKLKKLSIQECENLECLPMGIIRDDDDINSNRSDHISDSVLEELTITCRKMQPLEPLRFRILLLNLKELSIWKCPDLELFPEGVFDNLRSNLKYLSISECQKLRCLPNDMHTLTSLLGLSIWSCSGLVSFPEQGFPPHLIELYIFQCKNVALPMADWGLHKLTSLKVLWIKGRSPSTDMMDSFPPPPPDDVVGLFLLPTSLSSLIIQSFGNLKAISSSLLRLTSLQELYIMGCPKLHIFPKKGFPASLGFLYIHNSPLIKDRCIIGRGDYWPLLIHIPRVEIE